MSRAKLPLFSPLDLSTEEYTNADQGDISKRTSLQLYNVFLNKNGFAEMRPTFNVSSNYSNSSFALGDVRVHGAFYWAEKQREYDIGGTKLYAPKNAFDVLLDTASTGELVATTRPIFTTFKYPTGGTWPGSKGTGSDVMAIAGGGKIMLFDGTSSTYANPTGAPTNVTHVGYADGHLVCNEVGQQRLWWSDVLDPFTFNALNFAEAEGIPDDVTALHVMRNQVYLFGTRSIEIFYNDGTGFIPAKGQAVNMGCYAPYTIKEYNNSFIFLNDKAEVVIMSGGQIDVISKPIEELISLISDKASMFGMLLTWQGRYYYILQTPEKGTGELDGFTLVYDLENGSWYQWSIYRDDAHYEMPVYSTTEINPTLPTGYSGFDYIRFGSDHGWAGYVNFATSDGTDAYIDDEGSLQSASTYIQTTSPYISHGTQGRKISRALRFKLKGGLTKADVKVQYKDDISGDWSTARTVVVYNLARDLIQWIQTQSYQWGSYRNRQWRIIIDEPRGMCVGDFEEVFEVVEE